MKNLCFILSLFLMSVTAVHAQQKKGDFQLGGQLSYNSISSSGTTISFALIQFTGSYFITDQIEAGVAPLMMLNKDFAMSQIQLFANYSFLTSDAKFVPYAGAHIQSNSFKVSDQTQSSTGFGLRGGIRYFITENVNIDVGPRVSFGDQTIFIFSAGIGVIIGKH